MNKTETDFKNILSLLTTELIKLIIIDKKMNVDLLQLLIKYGLIVFDTDKDTYDFVLNDRLFQ